MDEEVPESMKSFIQTSMKTIDNEVRKCNVLKDELHVCKWAIKDLNSKIRNLELEAVRQKTCRLSVFDNVPLKSGSEDPCTTPAETLMNGPNNNVIDPARTMCDIWATWHNHELYDKRRQLRQATVKQAFGGRAVSEDAPAFQAAFGFMKGCQLKNSTCYNGRRKCVRNRCQAVDKSPEKRCMMKSRKKILRDMMTHMYDGDIMGVWGGTAT